MDAFTELQSQSCLKEHPQLICDDPQVKRFSKDAPLNINEKENETSPPITMTEEIVCSEQAQPLEKVDNCICPPCPTSTPIKGSQNDFINTPQTSPFRSTPLKATLSETEIVSIIPTSSIVSFLSADFIPSSASELPFPASTESIQPLCVGPKELNIVKCYRQTLKVHLPLQKSYSMNDTPRLNNLSPGSNAASLKRVHTEIENSPSAVLIKSPKKARITAGNYSTPEIRNRRGFKVSQPFRPPSSVQKASSMSDSATNLGSPQTPTVPDSLNVSETSSLNEHPKNKMHSKIRHSLAASKPFKSPFKSPLSSLSSVTNKSASSPNIRALEKQIMILKRAIKIVSNKEDEKLKCLIEKWTLAGREVAWELWSIMKDRSPEDAMWTKEGNGFNDSWNWASKRGWGYEDRTENNPDEESVGDSSSFSQVEAEMWNSINTQNAMKRQETENDRGSPHTLGTMLRSYGIADDILGWNNDEEDFGQV